MDAMEASSVMQERPLQIDGLTKRFPGASTSALTDVTLRFRPGVIKAVVGPNGAGKSTLFRIIGGLMEPDAGTLSGMEDPERVHRNRVALLPDSALGYYPRLSVLQNFIYLTGVTAARLDVAAQRDPREWLARFNLADHLHKQCQMLSRGMLQRLGLAIATASAADILLLDEPTNGLDIEESRRLFDLIKGIARASRPVIAFSSHQPDAILELADEVVFLVDGAVRGELSNEELTEHDSSRFVGKYLSIVAEARNAAQIAPKGIAAA